MDNFLWRCVMLSNADKAISHAITRPKIIATFHKNTKVQEDGCIVWTKGTNQNGYGTIGIRLKRISYAVYTHRFAWALKHGMDALPIGIGRLLPGDRMVLNHLCHNRRCVNTNHLEVILQSLNLSAEKKRPKNV